MVQSLIPVPHPALGARAGSYVAGKSSAVGAHACCRRAYRRERPTPRDSGRGYRLSQRGPNLAKSEILANEALYRVGQWQTFVHVQGEGPVRVHV